MRIDNKAFQSEIAQFRQFFDAHPLPFWDELPNLDLYVDQVIILINRYLSIYNGEERQLTHAMINNYVKQKIVPMPIKKRYSRLHVACLIMVVALKQSLSISTIQTLLPPEEDQVGAKAAYNSFVDNWSCAFTAATDEISEFAGTLSDVNRQRLNEIIVNTAVHSNVFKLFTEKLIEILPDESEAESKAATKTVSKTKTDTKADIGRTKKQ